MSELDTLIDAVFSDRDLQPEDVPRLDLYMDQVLSLFDDGFAPQKRDPSDKLLTKTMVHNYVKEGLISPVRGKKYTRQQIMQLLCVYHLKQELRLSDVKTEDVDFEAAYARLLESKERIRAIVPPLLRELQTDPPHSPDERLALCLTLSEIACYLRRLCESLIDAIPEQTGGK